jgi:indole-3-glycerol phosphate synthase/phosphoribosylanthranilate isomerase
MRPDGRGELPGILQEIVENRKRRVAAGGPLLSAQGFEAPRLPQSPSPFLPHGGVICEIKRRSPSRGAIASIEDPVALAKRYRDEGAAGISILTEEDHFGGSLADFTAVRKALPELPLLRKDFLFTPEDLEVSRRFGADAVLLITRILDDRELEAFFTAAGWLGLTVLAEAHSRDDILRLRPYKPPLVGMNSRDLATFRLDPFGPAALSAEVNWPARLIWESGVFGAAQARVAAGCGFSGVLVGEGVVRRPGAAAEIEAVLAAAQSGQGPGPATGQGQQNRPFFWQELARLRRSRCFSGPSSRPLVKICGITSSEDALAAAKAGADILGFILAPSPRQIGPEQVRRISGAFPVQEAGRSLSPLRVGVIVESSGDDEQIQLARRLYQEGAIDAVQLHGSAGPKECEGLDFPWYKAIRPQSPREAVVCAAGAGEGGYGAPRILLDAFSRLAAGGTGKQVDEDVVEAVKHASGLPLWLAGGVSPESVAKIVKTLCPELIDLSSGVESSPGKKDHGKIAALFTAFEKADCKEKERSRKA